MDQSSKSQPAAADEQPSALLSHRALIDRVANLQAEAAAIRAQLLLADLQGDAGKPAKVVEGPVPALEWRLEIAPDGVRFTRYVHGKGDEFYGTVPAWKAAIYAAAITQGFEPPRGLVRQDKPAG